MSKFVLHGIIFSIIVALNEPSRARDAVDDIRDTQVTLDALDIVDGIYAEVSLQNTSHQINHHNVPLLPKNIGKVSEYPHPFRIDHQTRRLRNRCTLPLHMETKVSREFENWMGKNVFWNIVVSLSLITDMNEPVIHAHFEFSG